jgi:hypothetical protein
MEIHVNELHSSCDLIQIGIFGTMTKENKFFDWI